MQKILDEIPVYLQEFIDYAERSFKYADFLRENMHTKKVRDLLFSASAMASSEVGEKEVQEYGIERKRLVKEFKYKHIFEFLENNPDLLNKKIITSLSIQ
jgi:hypothetical protein